MMSTQDLLIIALASLAGIIYLLIIRNFDLFEKESYLKLFLVAIFGGSIAITFSILIYLLVDVKYNFVDAFIKIGPIEEISKLLSLVIISKFIKSDLNELVDGLIYITAISLGFSVIENIFYAFKSTDPYLILFERSIFSIIGHISFSGYLGIAYYIHVRIRKIFSGILIAIIIASFAHGLFDAILFHKEINVLFRFAFYAMIAFQLTLLKLSLGFSTFRPTLSLDLFKPSETTIFLRCRCNNLIKGKSIRFHRINGGLCSNCNKLVLQGKNVTLLFKYFRPALRVQKYFKELPVNQNILYLDDKNKIQYNPQRSILCSTIEDLSIWLNESNINDRQKILETPLIGPLLLKLGIRYIKMPQQASDYNLVSDQA